MGVGWRATGMPPPQVSNAGWAANVKLSAPVRPRPGLVSHRIVKRGLPRSEQRMTSTPAARADRQPLSGRKAAGHRARLT